MKQRKGTGAEGYGNEHQKLRKRVKIAVDAGSAHCARCGRLIVPGEDWHLDHSDADRTRYLGPSHARCNIAASNRSPRRDRSNTGNSAPFFSPNGTPCSRKWAKDYLTAAEWFALAPKVRAKRREGRG